MSDLKQTDGKQTGRTDGCAGEHLYAHFTHQKRGQSSRKTGLVYDFFFTVNNILLFQMCLNKAYYIIPQGLKEILMKPMNLYLEALCCWSRHGRVKSNSAVLPGGSGTL